MLGFYFFRNVNCFRKIHGEYQPIIAFALYIAFHLPCQSPCQSIHDFSFQIGGMDMCSPSPQPPSCLESSSNPGRSHRGTLGRIQYLWLQPHLRRLSDNGILKPSRSSRKWDPNEPVLLTEWILRRPIASSLQVRARGMGAIHMKYANCPSTTMPTGFSSPPRLSQMGSPLFVISQNSLESPYWSMDVTFDLSRVLRDREIKASWDT